MTGSFTFSVIDFIPDSFTLRYHHCNATREQHFFKGDVSSLEMYEMKYEKEETFPKCLKDLIIQNQIIPKK